MNGDCIDKFQCTFNNSEFIMTNKERVYGINMIAADPFSEDWKREATTDRKTNLMQLVAVRFKKQDSFDVVVQIGDESFSVAMVILQSYSKFFQRRSAHEKVIELRAAKVTPNVFCKIFTWMMATSKLIEREGLIPFLISAQYLEVDLLEQQIWNLIQSGEKFQEDEAFMLYLEARLWKCEKVQDMMMHRVQRFFITVVCSEDFLEMEPEEVQNWLKLDTIGINAEVEVFYAAARWLLSNWDMRQEYLMPLMKLVRFGLIPPWRIVKFRMNNDMGHLTQILKDQELQSTLEASLSYSTYRNCFSDESEQFKDFLLRFGFKKLTRRDTMFDPIWQSTYKESPYTYEQFDGYLALVQENTNGWEDNMISAHE